METAARLIRDARRRAGLSRRAVARRARTSPATLARYESGDVEPGVAVLERIVAACGFELRTGLVALDPHDVALARMAAQRTPEQRLVGSANWAALRGARRLP